jgi:myosin heavy subunit
MMESVWVWEEHPQLLWSPVQVKGDASINMKGDRICQESTRIGEFDNLADMEEFGAPAVLYQVRKRYEMDSIYTWIGGILVSMNPYRELPLYSAQSLNQFLHVSGIQQRLSPHIYAAASISFQNLIVYKESQAFIISGEV